MVWKITPSYTYDSQAAAYISAIETVDGQALEVPVKVALNEFVLGCKRDGIWNAIKASCILAGARTLNGALVPLVGPVPTNVGPFVAGDYNRKLGLGDAANSTKYLNSNVLDSSNPQNNKHLSVYTTNSATISLAGALDTVRQRYTWIQGTGYVCVSSGFALSPLGASLNISGLHAVSRSSSDSFNFIINRIVNNVANSSVPNNDVPNNDVSYTIFARNILGVRSEFCRSKIAFYSIGESLDLAKLDARVTTLIAQFAAAIP